MQTAYGEPMHKVKVYFNYGESTYLNQIINYDDLIYKLSMASPYVIKLKFISFMVSSYI